MLADTLMSTPDTQAMYQMLDVGFVGLIFSTFNEASSGPHVQPVNPLMLSNLTRKGLAT